MNCKKANINFSDFSEPDLGDQLTAITFIVDERVFNNDVYPDFTRYLTGTCGYSPNIIKGHRITELPDYFVSEYNKWLSFIGGSRNAFLKTFLRQFRLA